MGQNWKNGSPKALASSKTAAPLDKIPIENKYGKLNKMKRKGNKTRHGLQCQTPLRSYRKKMLKQSETK